MDKTNPLLLVAAATIAGLVTMCQAVQWDQSTYLDENFRLLWNIQGDEITFEMQVRTHGYIGLGFARKEDRSSADVVIGWVDHGQTYFQDRHYKKNGAGGEPRIDPSEDYTLLLGYENVTHTVLRFQRKLDTCDSSHDVAITNDTMRVFFLYHPTEPRYGSIVPGSLPQPQLAVRSIVPLQLTQRTSQTVDDAKYSAAAPADAQRPFVDTIELRNHDVPLPIYEDALQWCRVFELNEFKQKHHLIKYEPIFGSPNAKLALDQIVLYECQGNSVRLGAMARETGRVCARRNNPSVPCNAIVASWTRGSAGLTFPAEAGFPLDSNKERFYMMESHYSNAHVASTLDHLDSSTTHALDDSGLRIHVTAALRQHDAGVLSLGINPDWRHIIPPGHEKVVSEGHCVDDCTRRTFPPAGISIFAVVMQTHHIGKEVKLRQIRQNEELLPIALDRNIHAAYAEYRQISPPARVLPGDNMIVECTYDSSERETITLGGTTGRGESCNVLAVYYPRQKKLTTCHSLPSLPTVLHSLGINEIAIGSQPVLISSPTELAGMTLESRLISYDWAQQFEAFQRVTRTGSFQAVCTDARHKTVLGSDNRPHYTPTVTKIWRSPSRSKCLGFGNDLDEIINNEIEVTEFVTRRRHAGAESMGLSSGHSNAASVACVLVAQLIALFVIVG